jgi:hypothetical protein
MDAEARKRLRWVELFLRIENYSVVCQKRDISRPTLRKMGPALSRTGADDLSAASRKPKSPPGAKILDQTADGFAVCAVVTWGREEFSEPKRVHDFDVSRTTIEKVLRAMDVNPLSLAPVLEMSLAHDMSG